MMTTIETNYTVETREAEDAEQVYYVVLDKDGDEVADYETLRDAEVEASDRNTNAAIEDAIGGLENLLNDLTISTRPAVLKAIRAMIETAERLVEEEE